jgi:hypothetical protein
MSGPAFAQSYDTYFELDGNADTDHLIIEDPLLPGIPDDWDRIWAAEEIIPNYDPPSAKIFRWSADWPSADDNIFTTGGSKDIQLVSEWQHTISSTPDKNDLLHGFAGLYEDEEPGSESVYLYFGADRYSTDGTAYLGFWFFQNAVGPDYETPPGNTWFGEHEEGDILVLANFTKGGVAISIEAWKWVNSCNPDTATCGSPNLELVATGVDCQDEPTVPLCATTNRDPEESPWPFTPKPNNGPDGQFPKSAFIEGFIDLNALGLDLGCNATFMAESRTSDTFTAQLKDFIIGDFRTCSIDVDKTGPDVAKVGDELVDATYTVTIRNTNITELFIDKVEDDVGGVIEDVTDEAIAGGCAILAPQGTVSIDPEPVPLDECTFSFDRPTPWSPDTSVSNTVTAYYTDEINLSGAAIGDIVMDDDDHLALLFQPSIVVTKTGDDTSKVGDDVTYSFTIENTSTVDTPDLTLNSISDDVLGSLMTEATTEGGCGTLATGATCSFDVTRTVLEGDADPLTNTVTVVYDIDWDADEDGSDDFPNQVANSDDHDLNLFTPIINVTKTGDELSKVGDQITYTITLSNGSSEDTPALTCTAVDDLLGTVFSGVLALGDTVVTETYVVQDGDPDPLPNEVVLSCTLDGPFTNTVQNVNDDHQTQLFQPAITFDKSGDAVSKVGDDVGYTLTLNNTSSADTPDLECTIIDGMLGINKSVTLASGASDVTNATYTVQQGDADPLDNNASVSCSPIGFENVLEDNDGHSVDLFQPAITFDKSGDAVSKVGDDVGYTLTLNNTSSADTPDLECTITDGMLNIDKSVTLASGESDVTNATYTVQQGDADPLDNTASVSCSPIGWPNTLTASDGHSVDLFQPAVEVIKTGDAISKNGDVVNYSFTINNISSADTPALLLNSVTDDVITGVDLTAAAVSAGCDSLNPGDSCSFGATRTSMSDDANPLINTVTVSFSPTGFENVFVDTDTHSVDMIHPDFEVMKSCTAEPVPAGSYASFYIDIANTGDYPLPINVDDLDLEYNQDFNLPVAPGPCTTAAFEAGDVDGCLRLEVSTPGPVSDDFENWVDVTATLGDPIPNTIEKGAGAMCEVEGMGPTRTRGFWQTHGSDALEFGEPLEYGYTCYVFEREFGENGMDLGWVTLNECYEALGAFWANNAKDSDGKRRNKVCKAQVNASKQLVAAYLNTGLPGHMAVPIDDGPKGTGLDILTALRNALEAGNSKEILRLMSLVDEYNNSGDYAAIVDVVAVPHADPVGTRNYIDDYYGTEAVDCQ